MLLKALSHVQRVVERRNTYPILANLHLSAGGNGITLRATDLDIEVTESVAAAVSAPFTTTVPASTLYDIVRKFSDGSEVTIEYVDENNAGVRSARSRFNLATLNPDSFPDLKSGTFETEFSIVAADLLGLLQRTQFAISSEETRYYLNGIFLHTIDVGQGRVLRAVATDGHRMARTEIAAPNGCGEFPGIIVPKKTIGELIKLLDGHSGEVNVEISTTKIRVTVGEVLLLSKLIEGTFPDYDRVTPKNNDKVLVANRKALEIMADRVGTIASDRGGKAVKLTATKDSLKASVVNADHGEATEDMSVVFDDDPFEIGFNSRYLGDVLREVSGDDVQFKFSDAGSPTLISAPGDNSTIMVLMPMRVS
jgi:DNA polymerase-3 subunit beta